MAAAPFGLLFGALAVDNGFSVLEATLMSAAILAAPARWSASSCSARKSRRGWSCCRSSPSTSATCSIRRRSAGASATGRLAQQALAYFFLTDPQYAEAERKAEDGEGVGFVWYIGMALAIYVPWVAESWLGATFGNLIPDPHALGIDFLLPIYFLGLVMEFRDRPAVAAGGGRQRSRVGRRLQDRRFALACIDRRGRRHPACRRPAAAPVRHSPKIATGSTGRMSTTLWIILWGAVVTYLTRVGGHLVLSRFEHIHPRVEAGLNAVPAAVLTTLVAPAAARPVRPS